MTTLILQVIIIIIVMIIIIMIIRVCTYEYYHFSPLEGLTIAWVLILIF
jgi:hypothetical protein